MWMPQWLDDFIFRRTVIKEILVRSGQARPSRWLQAQYGFRTACPYLVFCALGFIAALAAYLSSRNGVWIYLGGASISLVALLYGLLVSPMQGAMPAVREFVGRSQSNNVRPQIIVQNIPGVIDRVVEQVHALNAIYWVISIILFLTGVAIGGVSFLF